MKQNAYPNNSEIGREKEVYSISAIDKDFPTTAKDTGKATLLDPVLSKVLDLVMKGWPNECNQKDLKAYYICRHELSSEQNCIL